MSLGYESHGIEFRFPGPPLTLSLSLSLYIYIYKYILIRISSSHADSTEFPDSLSLSLSLHLITPPYHLSFLVGLQGKILRPDRADIYKSLLVGQHWHVYARVCKRTSLMSSSLLLQQCPAYLVCLTWMNCETGGMWPYSYCRFLLPRLVWESGLVSFRFVLWHINHFRLFNAKSFSYIHIKYMISKHILLIRCLNEPHFFARS